MSESNFPPYVADPDGYSECPHCGHELTYQGADGQTYSEAVLVEVRGAYDGGLFYTCPLCEGVWHRFSPDSHLHERAELYMRQWMRRNP